MTSTTDRQWRTADWLLAAAFIAVTQSEVWVFKADADITTGTRVAVAALVLVASVALGFRQTHPWWSFLANAFAIYALVGVGFPSDFYQWTSLLLTYSVAAHAPPRQAWLALPLAIGGVLFYFIRLADDGTWIAAGFSMTLWIVAWLAGRVYGARMLEARLRAERDLSIQMAALQEERLEIEAERGRIARELHDIIGHSVNVMVIHAGAGRGAVPDDPATAHQAFETIERTGRSALDELDRVLAILRQDDAKALDPPPTVADLPRLVDRLKSSGLDVDLAIEGADHPFPPSVGLSAYRIVQEALTNTLKHARASHAGVSVVIGPEHLDIEVGDDGIGIGEATPGRGTRGMTERASLHDGTLTVTPGDPGTVVRVTLNWIEPR